MKRNKNQLWLKIQTKFYSKHAGHFAHSVLMEKIEAGEDEGIKVIDVGEKGCGVAAEKDFWKGEYVCTYQGDLVLQKVALER